VAGCERQPTINGPARRYAKQFNVISPILQFDTKATLTFL
jgi:hypothetical protein